MSRATEFIDGPCRNCGDETPGRYCRACGQRKGEVRVSMGRLVTDVLEDQLSINAALPRTLAALFVHPGRLTAEYVRGRIAAYIAPFRLYLVASLVFFLVASAASRVGLAGEFPIDGEEAGTAPRDTITAGDTVDTAAAGGDPTAARTDSTDGRAGTERARQGVRFGITLTEEDLQADSIDWDRAINTGIPVLDEMVVARAERMGSMEPREAVRQIVAGFLEYAPVAMFVLLPVFALLLRILYIRSGRYYVEHFVFALHYHAFAFLLFTAIILLPDVLRPGLLLIWLLLYLPIALKRVYAQSVPKTFLKWIVLSSVYSILIGVGMVGTAVVAFLAG